jgi:glutamate synthase domain-containing protein 2/glutamate synthase domain-containing protein 1/glutamate synthase domain-containing protein 3
MRSFPPNSEIDHDACGVGFIAHLGGQGSREVVERALTALRRLTHRGGVDADGLSGDGAGLLLPLPESFFRKRARKAGIELPGAFGVGMAFLPQEQEGAARAGIEAAARRAGLAFLGWRVVPTAAGVLGPCARATVPVVRQCFFAPVWPTKNFERRLFLLRKRIEVEAPAGTYFCSLSSRTIVYKGLLTPRQLPEFYADLADPEFKAPFAVFHQRYSTNTQPSWKLAQPFRMLAHNGEINTIGSNRRWMRARESRLRRTLQAGRSFRALEEAVSDSANIDNALEILLQQGYSLGAAMLRMVPPAWEADPDVLPELRRFFETEAGEQEPWDGPAALVFSDGRLVGAKLDRNGLRPLRYTVTSDGLLVVGSEVGLTDLEGKHVAERQRLGPGEMLLVNPTRGTIFRGNQLADLVRCPRGHGSEFPPRACPARLTPRSRADLLGQPAPDAKRAAAALGWTQDQYRLLFEPLSTEGKEAVWSMGDDAPPAFLSNARRPLWDYCKQRFAQVTNPPIDPLREAHVMSLDVHLAARLVLPSPLLDAGQMAELEGGLLGRVCRIDFTFEAAGGVDAALAAIGRVRREAGEAAGTDVGMVLLSDRNVSATRAALPALLALAAAWKAILCADAYDVPVVIETGQVVETHHVALSVAAGASAVFPYLALQFSEHLSSGGASRYRSAVETGLRKVLARMGISTLASYRNSQLFEVVGLGEEVCAEFFEDAPRALGGKQLAELLADSLERHAMAFEAIQPELRDAGWYRFRQEGERHSSSPELVRRLHRFIKDASAQNYRAFAELGEDREPVAVRDLLRILPGMPVPLDDVESASAILTRIGTQAMSLGALGREAHGTLAVAMNRLGARSNTGEGGEDPDIYHSDPEANNRVKQVASARFGVTTEYLVRADELEIKIAQGSKPGEGGQLPAAKVTSYIARLRHAVPGMALISPPPHHDIYSIEDLAQLIFDLRAVNPSARIGVKLVSGAGVGIIAAGVAKAGADVITISGFDGGTGASPLTSIKNTGLPWEVGLREAHRALIGTGFRRRVRLRVDGGLKFGRDVVVAALLGADEFGFGTAALLAIGCVMARQCHLNTCPVGIATQDEKMRARFAGKPEMVMTYFRGVAEEVRELLSRMGAHSLDEIIGTADRLAPRNPQAERAIGRLLAPTPEPPVQVFSSPEGPTGVHQELSRLIEKLDEPVAEPRVFAIANSDRSIGAHFSGELLRQRGSAKPEAATIECEFRGIAGQSFGAFLVSGVHFRLLGEANDYVGKGLSGGTISISAGYEASRRGDVLAGNTVLYGATSGKLYIAGHAGERFAVRNSGALAVVEGVGQHGCEYMTGGIVVILGPAGINLGSGMTGGLTYILSDAFSEKAYHRDFVQVATIGLDEETWLRRVLGEHLRLTGSPCARQLLNESVQLPLMRLEPVALPCPIAQTWTAALGRDRKSDVAFSTPWETLRPEPSVEAVSIAAAAAFPRDSIAPAPANLSAVSSSFLAADDNAAAASASPGTGFKL